MMSKCAPVRDFPVKYVNTVGNTPLFATGSTLRTPGFHQQEVVPQASFSTVLMGLLDIFHTVKRGSYLASVPHDILGFKLLAENKSCWEKTGEKGRGR